MDIQMELDTTVSRGYSDVTNQAINVIHGKIRIVMPESGRLDDEVRIAIRCECTSLTATPSASCVQFNSKKEKIK